MAVEVVHIRKSDVTGDRGKDVTGWRLTVEFDATDRGAERVIAALSKLGLSDLVSIGEDIPPVKNDDRSARAAVRAWATENGYTIGRRGRIPLDITNAFEEAHNG